jgi:hypothetical protein
VYEEGDVTVLQNQAVHTDREVTTNRPEREREKTCMLIDMAIPVDRIVHKEGERSKNTRVYVAMNVENEMYDYTGNNGGHQNITRFKEKFGSHTRKTSIRLNAKASYTGTSHIIQKVLHSET